MSPGSAVIHLLTPDAISPADARAILSEEEHTRADRFHFPEDATRWTSFRAQLRQILGEALDLAPADVPLIFSEQQKPLLAPPHDGLHFNLSHCPDLAILALSHDGPVGVDLELLVRAPDLLECVSTFCHPAEIAALPEDHAGRATRLLEIWTAKEAVLKALGTGLIHPPEAVQVDLATPDGGATSDSPLPGLESQRIHVLYNQRLADYRAVLSAPVSVERVEII